MSPKTPRIFTAAELVGNDTDPDLANSPADVLHVASVTGGPGAHGSVVLNANGTVTYTPDADYAGPASFTYTVADAAGTPSANTATVSLTVTDVPDFPTVGDNPNEVAVSTNGAAVYVANADSDTVSVYNTSTGTVTNLPLGSGGTILNNPQAVVVSGNRLYVAHTDATGMIAQLSGGTSRPPPPRRSSTPTARRREGQPPW